MVSHGFSSAVGYACLTVMQTTVGEPRFALAVQGCLVSVYARFSFCLSFQLERIVLSGCVCIHACLQIVYACSSHSTTRTTILSRVADGRYSSTVHPIPLSRGIL